MPEVGNASTILSFLLLLFLNIRFLHGSQASILFLSPILLFLNTDRYLFKQLSSRNKYFPMIVSTSIFFTMSSLNSLVLSSTTTTAITTSTVTTTAIESSVMPLFSFQWIKNVVLLLLALPSHYYFNRYLWNFASRQRTSTSSTMEWMITIPLTILPAIFADLLAIQILAVEGFLGSLYCWIVSRQIQQAGKQYI